MSERIRTGSSKWLPIAVLFGIALFPVAILQMRETARAIVLTRAERKMRRDPNPTSQHGHVRWLAGRGSRPSRHLRPSRSERRLVPRLHSLLRGPTVSHMLTLAGGEMRRGESLSSERNDLGMAIVMPTERWKFVRDFTPENMASWLNFIAQRVPINHYRRSCRGPKKPPPRKQASKHHHYSNKRLLDAAKLQSTC